MRRWPRLVATCFVLLILLEIVIFAWVAEHIGLGLTLLALIGSAAAGLWLIHHTGLEMVGRLRLALAQGQEPGHSLVDGACFVIAGMFLILPGFFTDLLALLLILPVSRNWMIRRFAKSFGTPMAAAGGKAGSTIITDVEFREVHADGAEPGAAEAPAEATSDMAPAGEPQQPKTEPQIFVPAKAERAGGAAVRADVIDVELEAEPEAKPAADTDKAAEATAPEDTDTAGGDTTAESAAPAEEAA
ncbi:MAG TPA: FxsA family protein, partial [Terriglobales bacterium]|nr:FxsA family protein [Terriglobales bacterium]